MSDAHVHDLADVDPTDITRFGDRGTGLARLHRLGLPVAPTFIVDAEACRQHDPDGLGDAVRAAVARLRSPRLLTVRPGYSMPGPTQTVESLDELLAAIAAVFESWDSRRAAAYRKRHGIPGDAGIAVLVQASVSGPHIASSRDPKTGENRWCGEFAAELAAHGHTLEREYADAVDIEFALADGAACLLGVRPVTRTAAAAVRIALDLVDEGVIDPATALRRITVEHVRAVSAPAFSAEGLAAAAASGPLFTGVGVSPGQAVGVAVLDADRAAARSAAGEDVILLRPSTSPQDLPGMLVARAVVTDRGGPTSHAAVVCRSVHKPCVCGCTGLQVGPAGFGVDGVTYPEGTWLSVDGTTGRVYAARIPLEVPEANRADLARVAAWAQQYPVSEELGAALRGAK